MSEGSNTETNALTLSDVPARGEGKAAGPETNPSLPAAMIIKPVKRRKPEDPGESLRNLADDETLREDASFEFQYVIEEAEKKIREERREREATEEDSDDSTIAGVTLEGRFRVQRLLAEGGMGRVYQGVQLSVNRDVAIKVLRKELSQDESIQSRLRREAEVVSTLVHPSIVQLVEFSQTQGGLLYLVLEYVEGPTLEERLKLEPLPLSGVVEIATQLVGAIAEAHSKGIIHRDLKPENVLLTSNVDGTLRAKVLDFGLAYQTETTERITTKGAVFGTPSYMAPEQAMSQAVTPAADIYSLGVMLYQMISGRLPFEDDSPLRVMFMHVNEDPPHLDEIVDDVPEALIELVHEMMSKDAKERPSEPVELLGRLAAIRRELWVSDEADEPSQPGPAPAAPRTKQRARREPVATAPLQRPAKTSEAQPGAGRSQNTLLLLIGAGLLLFTLALGGVSYVLISGDSGDGEPENRPETMAAGAAGEAPVTPPELGEGEGTQAAQGSPSLPVGEPAPGAAGGAAEESDTKTARPHGEASGPAEEDPPDSAPPKEDEERVPDAPAPAESGESARSPDAGRPAAGAVKDAGVKEPFELRLRALDNL